jgi:hypothetical protein
MPFTMISIGKRRILLSLAILALFLGARSPSQALAVPPNRCVGIASDSNGFGHVTFQIPTSGDVGIIYVQPLWTILAQELRNVGLENLRVIDRSLSASGLTSSDPTNYVKSVPFGNLINDRCQFVIAGPFLPDVAAGKATPEQYSGQLVRVVNGLLNKNPNGIIFVLNFYQTDRAEFTQHSSGVGLTPERIKAFNTRLASSCRPEGSIGRNHQVICVDVQPLFEGMDAPYMLATTSQAQYRILVFRPTGFQAKVDTYFQENPDGYLIGDGIHLSMEGRVRLMRRMAEWISRINPL